ncbi:MAG TPA: catalase family peroxidase [Polyangiaceae bacterium]|jgi:catalase|nr:catalase family peroxidase [Polyangiaceae bacterium]
MPFPSDEKIMALSKDLLAAFDAIFGLHPGFRPVHAKGVMVAGTFTPAPDARSLTRAPHATRPSTPVLVRFSNSTGIPVMPDNDPMASPHGMAIRFQLGEHVHTDIIAHSKNGFPVRTGPEFLEFLRAIAATAGSKASPTPVEAFVGGRPAALAFVSPQPTPSSLVRENYFGITAMRFIDKDGIRRYGRYRIVPDGGVDYLGDAATAARGPNFLFDELPKRLAAGPVGFQVQVQVANEGDVIDDATKIWPDDRRMVTLGKLALTSLVPDDAHEQKTIIFDPIPRVDGIEPSDDPLLELRAAVYLLSGRRRRAAPETK